MKFKRVLGALSCEIEGIMKKGTIFVPQSTTQQYKNPPRQDARADLGTSIPTKVLIADRGYYFSIRSEEVHCIGYLCLDRLHTHTEIQLLRGGIVT